MNTLALGYVIPAIRAYSGLAPVRQCSCRAYTNDPMIYEYQGYENIAQKVNEQRKSVNDIAWKNKDYWKSLSNINKVVVYGHSLSEVDMAYFHEIANNVANDCEWYFSIHSSNLCGKVKALKHVCSIIETLGLKKLHCHTFMM